MTTRLMHLITSIEYCKFGLLSSIEMYMAILLVTQDYIYHDLLVEQCIIYSVEAAQYNPIEDAAEFQFEFARDVA
jgi:hypothetical protein